MPLPEILVCPRTPYTGKSGKALLVLGAKDIEQWTSDVPHILISIQAAGREDWPLRQSAACWAVLRLNFDDVKTLDVVNTLPCLRGHGREIASFVRTHVPHVALIVCQCHAGVAAALSTWLNGEDRWFHEHYAPNCLVYKRVTEALEETP